MKFLFNLIVANLVFTSLVLASPVLANEMGEAPIFEDEVGSMDVNSEFYGTRKVITFTPEEIKELHNGNIYHDSLLNLSVIRAGTKYVWGGGDWQKGVDCSHFTMKIYQDIGLYYDNYFTTHMMKNIKSEKNGLVKINPSDMRPGDLLVYGYYDQKKWHGHVVVLVDASFRAGKKTGLVVGSHGVVGVQYLAYKGFPDYYRKPKAKLRTVLRIKR